MALKLIEYDKENTTVEAAEAVAAVPKMAIKPSEAAELLGVSMPTVYELTRRADFPSFKIGNRTLISVELLGDWIRRQVEIKNEV